MNEYVAYHQDSSHRVLPGDPIMDRLGDVATFVRAMNTSAGQPCVVVQRGLNTGQTSLCRPEDFNLDLILETDAMAQSA